MNILRILICEICDTEIIEMGFNIDFFDIIKFDPYRYSFIILNRD